jgi:predicted hydrocarbon binding protein
LFGIISDLILHKRLKFENGRVDLIGKPVAMFPLEYITTLQKDLEEKGLDNQIYLSAKKMGYDWFKHMYDYFKIKPEDVTKWGINILSVAGWGKTEISKMDTQNKLIKYIVRDATQSKVYGKSDHAVDYFFRGCAAASATVLFKTECDAVESKCTSLGDAQCEFICKPRDSFDMTNELVKRQLRT